MYKAFQNKKYYLAFNRFPKTAKNQADDIKDKKKVKKGQENDFGMSIDEAEEILLG